MADALAVIAEYGFEGFQHNHPVDILSRSNTVAPRKEFALIRPSSFSPLEFEYYLVIAWRDGLIVRTGYKEDDEYNPSYSGDYETIQLTVKGWKFLEDHRSSMLSKWISQVSNNLPTVVTSIIGALATRYLLEVLGLL